jgi:hypothetical protein
MKSAGKVNRRLTAFLVESGIGAGDTLDLTDGGESSKPAGTITSVSPQPDSGSNSGLHPALGYLEKAAFTATELRAGGKQVRVV